MLNPQFISQRAIVKRAVAAIGIVMLLSVAPPVLADMGKREAVHIFIDEMVTQHQFERQQLQQLFTGVSSNSRVIKLITSPAEKKPWYEYRPIFLTRKHIRGGKDFMRRHADVLRQAEQQYGVPAEIITAIIGVETRYGGNTGSFNVVRALATLAFDYPPRAAFFRSELQHLLLLSREQGLDASALEGSYAGAMGLPQFISSSYRNYAVDFDNDDRIDIWRNFSDAIGSVANYLQQNGWRRGEKIAHMLDIDAEQYRLLVIDAPQGRVDASRLKTHGVVLPAGVQSARILELATANGGNEYWLALPNFDCITTYNRSDLYAMAVLQLSREVRL